jgi:twitching motility protein PilJ
VDTTIWSKVLVGLAALLTIVLLALAFFSWPRSGGIAAADPGRFVATVQALRSQSRSAIVGDVDAFDRLAESRVELGRLRAELLDDSASAGAQALVDSEAASNLELALDRMLAARSDLERVARERIELTELAPELLVATGNLASALSTEGLAANQRYLDRFELTVQRIRQTLQMLEAGEIGTALVETMRESAEYLGEIFGGLSGEGSALDMVAVDGPGSEAELTRAAEVFAAARTRLGSIVASAETMASVRTAVEDIDAASQQIFDRYGELALPSEATEASGSALVAGLAIFAALIVLAMAYAYVRGRDDRAAGAEVALQNQRNQQAILRLLDELTNLADGDLTVQATVTEDITGAIADSINYAIEALRELVTTVKNTSLLVDAAAKQTESASHDLLRANETQVKQAAAASDSIARVVMSIEEVAGNAERCADVARHAVDVAHKGGEAVRRTIDGMNTIREQIQDTSKRIKRLGESSQEIGDIVELIEEIAEQTNILALNASIEASRAGESSRGFAVVADEVQKLAERSSTAARQIDVLVSTIQSDTNEAVVSMERSTTDVVGGALLAENAGAALVEIEQVSHQIASLVQNISTTTNAQNKVAGNINENMRVLRQISSRTTESSASTSSAIGKLSQLASKLRETISGFTLPAGTAESGVLRSAESIAELGVASDSDRASVVEGNEDDDLRRQSG